MGVTAIVGEIHRSIGSTKGAAARRRFKTNQTATHVETGAYAHQDRGSTPLASTSFDSQRVRLNPNPNFQQNCQRVRPDGLRCTEVRR